MFSFIKQLVPPILVNAVKLFRTQAAPVAAVSPDDGIWQGDYADWASAMKQCSGYDNQAILDKCREALLKVKNGEAVYERDSVLFDKIQYSWPLLACLENAAISEQNKLHILDFGGSLGTTYFQNRHFLRNLPDFKWVIVEQEHFVEAGKKEFEDGILEFKKTPGQAFQNGDINCLLLSSVLQYLPDPVSVTKELINYLPEHIILDRTGFIDRPTHSLTVQNVPEQIYQASYPCWFFNEASLLSLFADRYELVAEFNDSFTAPVFVNQVKCYWKGFYLKKKSNVN